MKKAKIAKQFLAELENNPNVAIACKRVGLSRQTVYRWQKTDVSFKKDMDEAMTLGTESILDLAESKLVANVANGNQRAIETVLDYYGKRSERNKSSNNEHGHKSLADLLMAAHKAKP